MTPKQAYQRVQKIHSKITALYKAERALFETMAPRLTKYRPGDIFSVRDPETNRLDYWTAYKVDAVDDHSLKSLRPIISARRCTKEGDWRGLPRRMDDKTMARATLVCAANNEAL